jgi:HSP20 family protein
MTTLIKKAQRELDRPDWFPRWFGEWPDSWRDLMEGATMKIEEFEDDGYLVVRAEMPGIDPDEDVEITVDDHRLHLRAERRSEETTEDKRGYRSEFRYGSFERMIALPAGATEADVTATYKDGILEVRVPIDVEQAEAKRITVERT